MAKRRMFSLEVIDTDSFLDMPISSQLLYFHLGMRADDDGFVASPKRVTTLCGCSSDDLKLLTANGYIISFPTGVCALRDWRVNNCIKSDRYTPTLYTAEKRMLRSVTGKPYDFLDTSCIHSVSKLDTQYSIGKDRLGKDRSGKDSLDEEREASGSAPSSTQAAPAAPSPQRHKHGEYKNVLLTDGDLEKLQREFPDYLERIDQLSRYMESTGKKYKSHLATIRNWARRDRENKPTPPRQRGEVFAYDYTDREGSL